MSTNKNIWNAVQIENVGFNSLEGLVGIEECTDYDLNDFKPKNFVNLPRSTDNGKTIKKKKKNKKKLSKSDIHSTPLELLSPSKSGSTFTHDDDIDSIENIDTETEPNLEAWANLPLQDSLFNALKCLNFTQPTPIQLLTLPPAILGKKDILGAAETGSGKTLAFGLPMLHGILKLKENFESNVDNTAEVDSDEEEKFTNEGIGLVKSIDNIEIPNDPIKPLYGLILTPTRELAMQIKQHLSALAQFTDISVAVIVGGMAIEKQLRILSKKPDIIVATPGRLWELIEKQNPHLMQIYNVKYLAIDETDRMIEKGHFKELKDILERLNADDLNKKERQNFVFSATLTFIHEIPKYLLTKKKMRFNSKISDMSPAQKLKNIVDLLNITNPKVVDITDGKGTSQTLTESRITCNINEKDYYVYYFLKKHPGRTLIFCNSIGCVRRLVTILSMLNCNPLALHSSLQQRQRLKYLDKFKENENGILIATDVAARGLDIACIQHVIHYQTPRTSESYIHRSGRTARASKEGITILLVEPGELQQYLRLCRTLGKTEDIPLFPIQHDMLNSVKKRVNLARELDKLELRIKKTNSESGWLQKAADEMDLIIDDDLQKYDKTESQSWKKAANIKRKELAGMLEMPLFSRKFSFKYPLINGDSKMPFMQNENETNNAVEVMKNALVEKSAKRVINTKHLFKSKIRKNANSDVNMNAYLKKSPNLKKNFKKGKQKRKNRR